MTDFTIKIAGQVVAVAAMFHSSKDYCKDYLCNEEAAYAVQITPRDLDLERQKNAKAGLKIVVLRNAVVVSEALRPASRKSYGNKMKDMGKLSLKHRSSVLLVKAF